MRRGWKHYGQSAVSKNPYFSEINDRVATQYSRTRYAQWLGGSFVVIGFLLALFFHPAFRIHTVRIEGIDPIFIPEIQNSVQQILNSHRYKIIPNNHYLFYPATILHNTIAQVLYAKQISINPQWGRVLAITIIPYPTVLFWKAGDAFYAINHQGIITEQIPKIEHINESIIIEDSAREVHIGQSIMNPEMVEWIIQADTAVHAQLNQNIKYVFLSLNHPEIVQIQLKQLSLTFDINNPVEAQILRLKIFLGSKPSILNEKHAIDLRFKEKIYYQ